MATSGRTHAGIVDASKSSSNGLVLIWLDDSAEEDQNVKGILSSLFDNVITFTDHEACLELIESNEIKTACLSVLISGKYGQMLVRDHLQPLNQVQYIYVFCFDTVKHSRWAQTCDKVRCVFSDINKILQCMQYDIQTSIEQQHAGGEQEQEQEQQQQQQEQGQGQEQEQEHEQEQEPKQQRERFADDNNLLDQLALGLLLQSPDEGAEDFANYCRTHIQNNNPDHHDVDEEEPGEEPEEQYYKPEQPIEEWYQPNLVFTNINSSDLTKLWTLRWFIRSFHRQLTNEHEKFIKDKTKFTVNHSTWLSIDELDAMKHRVGQKIIFTELLMTYTNRQAALDSIPNDEKNNKYKVIFEINIDPTNRNTIPYAEIKKEQVLLWFGARYHLIKIEFVEQQDEQQDAYWLIGLNLHSTLNPKPSIQNLYQYYHKEITELNDIHHAFGRILMYQGSYAQAEKWLQTGNHYQELTELAIRQGHYEQAKQYLEQLPEDSYNTNLLHAYLNILTSADNFAKARFTLMKILSEATDKYIRAQANIVLGFINLIITQQIDVAFDHFTIANDILCQILPDIHPIIAKSYIGMGYTYYIQHNIVDARKCFQTALNIQKQSLTYNHPDFAKTRNGIAHCYSSDKQTVKQALNEFEYAYHILLDAFRHEHQNHPEILATKNDIEKLRKGKELRSRNVLLDYI